MSGERQLESVVDRFQESSEVLERLSEKLRSLSLAEERSSEIAKAVEEASAELRDTSGRLREVLEEIVASQEVLRDAMQEAHEFVQAAQLGELKDGLQVMRQQLTQRFDDRSQELEERFADLETERKRREEAEQELARIQGELGWWGKKKLGFE